MYKRDQHYNEKISTENLYKELDTHYNGETDLVRNLMSYAITDELIETRHELSCANEELWCLNDWPEGEGFGSSDRSEYLRRIKETVAFERKFLQAENELVQINKLEESPLNDRDEEYGFSHSDRTHEIRNIIETTDFERKFLQAETELVTINRLEKSPKNDTVRAYMKMNDKLKEGMVA